MPTPGGLPRAGEVWQLAIPIPGKPPVTHQVVVTERTPGSYWGLRIAEPDGARLKRSMWTDGAYWLERGWLTYVGPAGPETCRRLGLHP